MIIYGFKWFSLFVLLFLIIGSSLLFSFYGDYANFVFAAAPWVYHGGCWNNGVITGEFALNRSIGDGNQNRGSRLVRSTIIYLICLLLFI